MQKKKREEGTNERNEKLEVKRRKRNKNDKE